MNKFLRRIVLVDTSGLLPVQRDTLINKINHLSQDFHYMKFNILTHPECLAVVPKDEDQVDYIRKVDLNFTKFNLCTGSYFSAHCKITSNLQVRAQAALAQFFPGDLQEETLPAHNETLKSSQQAPVVYGGYCKNLDLYKTPELTDIDSVFNAHSTVFKNTLKEECESANFFRSYRNILDMEHLSDRHNTYVFWKTYIKQMWEQANSDERIRIWTTLNDLTGFQRSFILNTSELRERHPVLGRNLERTQPDPDVPRPTEDLDEEGSHSLPTCHSCTARHVPRVLQ